MALDVHQRGVRRPEVNQPSIGSGGGLQNKKYENSGRVGGQCWASLTSIRTTSRVFPRKRKGMKKALTPRARRKNSGG